MAAGVNARFFICDRGRGDGAGAASPASVGAPRGAGPRGARAATAAGNESGDGQNHET